MKWLSAGLTFVNVATVSALLLGTAFRGLGRGIAIVAMLLGAIVAVLAFLQTRGGVRDEVAAEAAPRPRRYRHLWMWMLAACFAFFAFRSFCWLVYFDSNQLKVQSPNNLGDLAIHITYIKNFASGVPLWPENPIFPFSNMRYPAGTDLFNSLLLLVGADLLRGLIWAALIASVATFYALYRWSGSFGVAAFLFNGGLAGFQIAQTLHFMDYQGKPTIAWKSLALSMLVTQRGVLYALPVGLLLLYHWREKYFAKRGGEITEADNAGGPLPFWIELTLYASMPLFHVHTFMALSIVAAVLFVIGNAQARKQLAIMIGAAFIPATFFMWTITDHFHASSVLKWKPGWVQTGTGDMAMPFFTFWIFNFGAFVPLVLALVAILFAKLWQKAPANPPSESPAAAQSNHVRTFTAAALRSSPAYGFVIAATLIFLFACLVKTAPWEWDNIKLIIWSYLIVLPFLWREVIAGWPMPVRAGVCAVLFASGFVSLIGGLVNDAGGFGIGDRAEIDAVGAVVRKLPLDARFASYPTYNHPLLLQGRRVVMGYPGHLWTQGFDYSTTEKQLEIVMRGLPGWREQAKALGARYLYWGREEKAKYAGSTRVWEREARLVATGAWGAIYDLEAAPPGSPGFGH